MNPDSGHDLGGAVHVHSLHSDGTGTVPEIARAAAANDLDFVLLTDHDTLAAADRGEEGWHGSVLVLVGEEVSPLRQNHYLAFGLTRPIDHRGLAPGEIVAAVNRESGFGFLSHPFSRGSPRFSRGGQGMPWRDLDAAGYTGLELWSFVTDTAEHVASVRDLVRFIAAPGRFVDHPPRRNLVAWDALCRERRCVGLGGIDAHQVGVRVGRFVPLRLMAYRRSFSFLRTHALLDRPLTGDAPRDRDALYAALRAGRCYLAMDRLAAARGFRFEGDGVTMGEEIPARPVELRARLPRAADVTLLRDGHAQARAHSAELSHRVEEPGVYRIAATLPAYGRARTWILSNPIYLR